METFDFAKGDHVTLKSGGPAMTVLDVVPGDPEHHVVCGLSTLWTGYQLHSIPALALQLKQRDRDVQPPFNQGDIVALRSGGSSMVVLDLVPGDPEQHVVCGLATSVTGYEVHSIPAVALVLKTKP